MTQSRCSLGFSNTHGTGGEYKGNDRLSLFRKIYDEGISNNPLIVLWLSDEVMENFQSGNDFYLSQLLDPDSILHIYCLGYDHRDHHQSSGTCKGCPYQKEIF